VTYHLWTSGPDAWGLVPAVFARLRSGQRDRATHAVAATELAAKPRPIQLEQDTLMEGPPRHVDLVEWVGDGSPRGRYIIVSQRVHALLEQASLPSHVVVDVDVQFASKRQKQAGVGQQAHFLYAFGDDELIDCFDLQHTELSCTVRLLSERARFDHRLPAGSVIDGAAAWAVARSRCPEGQLPHLIPAALQVPINLRTFRPELDFSSSYFPLTVNDLDLVYLDHEFAPRIGEDLRAALVEMGATGMAFQDPWDASRIVASCKSTRASRLLQTASMLRTPSPQDAAFASASARRSEVLSRDDRVRTARQHLPAATDDDERALRELEARLDLVLPAAYRAALSSGGLPKRGRFRFFAADELRTLEQIDPRWSEKSCPEAVRALLVAVDGHGDYLGYLLRSDSSTDLDDTLMHFHHETAELTKSKIKLKARAAHHGAT
jgi:hypothetical protein